MKKLLNFLYLIPTLILFWLVFSSGFFITPLNILKSSYMFFSDLVPSNPISDCLIFLGIPILSIICCGRLYYSVDNKLEKIIIFFLFSFSIISFLGFTLILSIGLGYLLWNKYKRFCCKVWNSKTLSLTNRQSKQVFPLIFWFQ